jgi:2-phospho-L-lactate/phosphoenolpyruvate guanylyltransferase
MIRWAVIPMKPLDVAKSRLSSILDDETRKNLVIALFTHTVSELQESGKFGGITVVTADPYLWKISQELGIQVIEEPFPSDLNDSLANALDWMKIKLAQSVLILPGDLPYLSSRLLLDMATESELFNLMMVSPDHHLSGTNALQVTPKEGLRFEFGDQSFIRHVHLAKQMEYNLKVYMSDQLKVDIDTPEDYGQHRPILEHLLEINPFKISDGKLKV